MPRLRHDDRGDEARRMLCRLWQGIMGYDQFETPPVFRAEIEFRTVGLHPRRFRGIV